MDDHPNWWLTMQCVLCRVRRHISGIADIFREDITLEEGCENLSPRVRSIGACAMHALVDSIVEDALNGELVTCPQLSFPPPHYHSVAKAYVTGADIPSPLSVHSLQNHCGEHNPMWKTILLLHGLLAHGVLSYALGTRSYCVDYGLTPQHSMAAVSYLAKDVPSLQVEFGHPNVCIILTCLSYHYSGLTEEQVFQCFEILLRLDHWKEEYSDWVKGNHNIPENLRDLDVVNLKDPDQRKSILGPLFGCNHAVVDFFLSHVVFPK